MTSLSLTAWSTVEAVGLTPAQAHAIAATGAVTVTPGWVAGTHTVTAGPYVGVLFADGIELRLSPRISIARLLFLMGYAQDPRAWKDDPSGWKTKSTCGRLWRKSSGGRRTMLSSAGSCRGTGRRSLRSS